MPTASHTPKKSKASNPPPLKKVAYFNRELSWLAFNRRVLDLAHNPRVPLLERVRFLAIVSSNLDEFFEIRVAGLVQQVDSGVVEVGMDGLGPKELLRRIHHIAGALVADQYRCWKEELQPALREQGIFFKDEEELTRPELNWLENYYHEHVYPVLTPMAIDPSHPFPQLTNKALYVLLSLDNPDASRTEKMMAIVPVPRVLPRLIHVDTGTPDKRTYVFLSSIVRHFAASMFPGYKPNGVWPFRVTRNSDLYIDEEEAANLIVKIEEELHRLRRGAAVRLEIRDDVEESILAQLLKAINLPDEYVFRVNGPVNLMRLFGAVDDVGSDRPELLYQPFQPRVPEVLAHHDTFFTEIARRDRFLHHPYESFNPVVDFLREAGRDPQVFAIKQTLYRTGGDSPIVEALIAASRNGKQVTALVELKARFDEMNNIQWARQLEEEGVHVVYGLVGLKTHCKCCLVVRREKDGLRRYAHLGTGNYNSKTARIYSDISFFTADPRLTDEVADVFNALTGFALKPTFNQLLVAPFNLHAQIQAKILREAANAAAGKPARIIAKINSLVDQVTMDNLYRASQAGVKIDLVIRGICGLVPRLKGLSENIRVTSIVGRFLEHSRIYYFENSGGSQPELYLGSADWMPRNMYRRIEVVFPIYEPQLRRQLIEDILPAYLRDNAFATELHANGAYLPVARRNNEPLFSVQDYFLEQAMALASAEAKAAKKAGEKPALRPAP
ncbi:MAG: polyphosphate kinase 1 [Opitutales bacterium]|jgi:polyphosphate kinase